MTRITPHAANPFTIGKEARHVIKFAAIGFYAASFAVIAAITATAPLAPSRDTATYQLVVFHGNESDITDYDLSDDDCRAAAYAAIAAGNFAVTCERTN